jgi:hypothetical protein
MGRPGCLVVEPEAEQILYQWIKKQRSLNYPIAFKDLRTKMLELALNPTFKARSNWIYSFLDRFNLSLRKPTKLVQRLSKSSNLSLNDEDQ